MTISADGNEPTPVDALHARQTQMLRTLLATLDGKNEFYTDRLRAAKLNPATVRLEEFTATFPLTHKAELAADQEAHPPYGTNLTFPLDQYVRLHQTSSTTGEPLRWLDTQDDWQQLLEGWKQVLRMAGVTSRECALAAFSFGPFIGLWMAFEAAVQLGCLCIPGGAMNSIMRLRAILANDVTVLFCTPTYALRLGDVAREEGIDLAQSCVHTIIVAGEPGGSISAVRERIAACWPDARVFDHHGMTETGPVTYECPHTPGLLHVMEDAFLAEVIDRETLQPIAVDGERMGELVLTTLLRPGAPVLRYATGDIVQPLRRSRCACGSHNLALAGGIISRADDMVFIRGVNVYPAVIESVLRQISEVVEFECHLTTVRGLAELTVVIEPRDDADAEKLCATTSAALRSALNIRIPVMSAAAGSLPRYELKARRWKRVAAETTESDE
ncbi:MAG: phenylacetate--CoA ligase family protein [Phycisphaerales bacterium]